MAGGAPQFNGRPGFFRPQADINVTPLVDVMLVLLIIFMVTAPLLATGVKVDLPQAKAAKPLDPKAPVVVAIDRDGHIALGAEQIDRADLLARVKLKLGDDLSQVVHIRGDKDVAFGQIVSVMDELAHNGLTHLAIVTDSSRKPADAAPAPQQAAPGDEAK
jgi:biopolymer transport protein ExbD/biopolymer transport protein TolR